MAKSNTNLSGESIALGFLLLGLTFAYIFPNAFDRATSFISATLVVIGIGAFLMEIQKRLKDTKMRFENGGIGLMLGVLTFWLMSLSYEHTNGIIKYLLIIAVGFFFAVGLMAVIDFFVSMFESLVTKASSAKQTAVGTLKFLALLGSTLGSIAVAWQQLGISL